MNTAEIYCSYVIISVVNATNLNIILFLHIIEFDAWSFLIEEHIFMDKKYCNINVINGIKHFSNYTKYCFLVDNALTILSAK